MVFPTPKGDGLMKTPLNITHYGWDGAANLGCSLLLIREGLEGPKHICLAIFGDR